MLDEDRINMDERQVVTELQFDAAIGTAKPNTFGCSIDDVGWIGPITAGMQSLARDERGIQQILNIGI